MGLCVLAVLFRRGDQADLPLIQFPVMWAALATFQSLPPQGSLPRAPLPPLLQMQHGGLLIPCVFSALATLCGGGAVSHTIHGKFCEHLLCPREGNPGRFTHTHTVGHQQCGRCLVESRVQGRPRLCPQVQEERDSSTE